MREEIEGQELSKMILEELKNISLERVDNADYNLRIYKVELQLAELVRIRTLAVEDKHTIYMEILKYSVLGVCTSLVSFALIWGSQIAKTAETLLRTAGHS